MDHETEIAIAELKGELKASRAENEAMESRIDARLAGVDASLALMREDAARRDADAAKRDKDNQRWIVGFGIAQVVLTAAVLAAGFAFLGILIGLPAP